MIERKAIRGCGKMYNTWEELEEGIKECQKCKLCKTRKNIVFGVRE